MKKCYFNIGFVSEKEQYDEENIIFWLIINNWLFLIRIRSKLKIVHHPSPKMNSTCLGATPQLSISPDMLDAPEHLLYIWGAPVEKDWFCHKKYPDFLHEPFMKTKKVKADLRYEHICKSWTWSFNDFEILLILIHLFIINIQPHK